MISESVSSEAGVERIFPDDKNRREKFVVGVKSANDPADTTKYTANILFAAATQAAQPAIMGDLIVTDVEELRGFHYADSLLFSQLDGKVVPQRIVRESKEVSDARESILVLEETGIAISWAPDNGFGAIGMNTPLADVLAEITIGTETAETAINQNSGSQSRTYSTAPFRGFSFIYEWNADTGRYTFRLTTNADHPFNDVSEEPIQVVLTRRTRPDERSHFAKTTDTYTADFNPAVGGTRSLSAAQGFKAEKLTITNPPIQELTETEYTAEVARIGQAYCVTVADGSAASNKGEAVLVFDGTSLSARVPGDNEVGYSVYKDKATYFAMTRNPVDGWTAVFGFRHGRLFESGSNQSAAQFNMSVAGDGLNFLSYTREGENDSELVQKVESDFALSRTLDSFSPILDVFADNGFVIFTERGEWSIQGSFQAGASGIGSARARRYSPYGTSRNAGVATVDNQIFFTARNAAFSIKFQGDDLGYPDAVDITARRNELALGGRNGRVVRLAAGQPQDLTGAQMVLFLVELDDATRYIACWNTESNQQHFAWSKWTFPNHRIIDLVEVDNRFFVLADLIVDGVADATKRGLYAFSAEDAENPDEDLGGDQIDNDGTRAAFPCILTTPNIQPVYLAGDGALVYLQFVKDIYVVAEQAGGLSDVDRLRYEVFVPSGPLQDGAFENRVENETEVPSGMSYGVRRVPVGQVALKREYRQGLRASVRQENLLPLHILRLDLECDGGPVNRPSKRLQDPYI